jgi:hypothetical protein
MKKLLSAALAALCLCAAFPAFAQTTTGAISQANQDTFPVNISTATTTQLIPASGFKNIYVNGGLIYAGGTGNFTFVAGTGTNCATGQRTLSGPIPLKDQGGFVIGGGLGVSLRLRATEALCATTSAAVQISGWLTADQH